MSESGRDPFSVPGRPSRSTRAQVVNGSGRSRVADQGWTREFDHLGWCNLCCNYRSTKHVLDHLAEVAKHPSEDPDMFPRTGDPVEHPTRHLTRDGTYLPERPDLLGDLRGHIASRRGDQSTPEVGPLDHGPADGGDQLRPDGGTP